MEEDDEELWPDLGVRIRGRLFRHHLKQLARRLNRRVTSLITLRLKAFCCESRMLFLQEQAAQPGAEYPTHTPALDSAAFASAWSWRCVYGRCLILVLDAGESVQHGSAEKPQPVCGVGYSVIVPAVTGICQIPAASA